MNRSSFNIQKLTMISPEKPQLQTIDPTVQIVAGSLVAIGTMCGVLVSPWFLLLSGFVGCGLVCVGISDTCAMGMLLAKLPYDRRAKAS